MAKARAKQAYLRSTEVQAKIDDGTLDAYDLVFLTDTKQYAIVNSKNQLVLMKTRLDIFDTEEEATTALNTASDTYSGQIVSILYNGKYIAYVVNKDSITDKFVVTKASAGGWDYDYSLLQNTPISNLNASPSDNIVLSDLVDGTYSVKGTYKIYPDDPTTHMTTTGIIYTIRTEGETTYVKETSADGDKLYAYNTDTEDFVEDEYATKAWTKETVPEIVSEDYATEDQIESLFV